MSDRTEAIARLEAALANALRRERAFGGDGSVIVDIPDLHTLLAELAVQAERIKVVEGALRRIANWELPPSGEFYPNEDGTVSDRTAPYDSFYAFGTQGGKAAIQSIAARALGEPSDEPG